jgi:hypothetical protein
VIIPPKIFNSDFAGLALWIAPPTHSNDNVNTLCLIEDNRRDDDDDRPFSYSSYSALSVFLEYAGISFNIDEEKEFDVETEFHKNPLTTLKRLGAHVYPSRIIYSVYRERVTATRDEEGYDYDWTEDDMNVSELRDEPNYTVTIGYPIWIIEGGFNDIDANKDKSNKDHVYNVEDLASDHAHQLQLLQVMIRRLRQLEIYQGKKGIDTEPGVIIEIEDLNNSIANAKRRANALKEELEQLGSTE